MVITIAVGSLAMPDAGTVPALITRGRGSSTGLAYWNLCSCAAGIPGC